MTQLHMFIFKFAGESESSGFRGFYDHHEGLGER